MKKELHDLYNHLHYKQWDVTFEKETELRPYDVVLVKIFDTSGEETIFWQAELSFLPGLETDLEGFHLVQCFVPVVLQVPAALNDALSVMITRINTKLPLVGFGLLESHAAVYFKHNLLLPHEQVAVNGRIVEETLTMTGYLLHNFHQAFADVALTKKTAKEAMETMPFSQLYV